MKPAGASFLCGLIGAGIQASRTPAMHEREADEQGLRCVYKLIDLDALGLGVEALPELLTAAKRMGFAGLNITHPCKQAIIPLLDELSDDARALDAVNTVVIRDGRLHRPQHRLVGLRRGLPARPAGGRSSIAWCSSAPAGRARRSRTRR